MNRLRHISAIAAAAFAAGLSFTITACSDSSSTNSEGALEPIGADYALGQEHASETVLNEKQLDSAYCDSVTRLEVPYTCGDSLGTDGIYYKESGYLRQEAAGCTYKCQNNKWSFVPAKDIPGTATIVSDYDRLVNQSESASTLLLKKCNAESEGLVQTSTTAGTPKYGYDYIYYRCEQGNWKKRDAWVACDTAGVSEGELCQVPTHIPGFAGSGYERPECYKYAGNGTWNEVDCPTEPEKECNEENKGTKEKLTSTNSTEFFRCSGSKWIEIDYAEYYCSTGKETFGDTCSLEIYDERYYFRYDSISENYAKWVDAVFDPELGFCTATDYWTYAQKGGKYYYCVGSEWRPASLVPRQYTDPRKEGLTDEEYDVLDLPKDAKVGDRANGLLEYCNYDIFLESPSATVDTYDYCFSPNRYRYREDGSWTAETPDETREDEIDLDSLPCGGSTWCCAETEGMKRRIFEGFDEPERVYQCVSGEIKLVEYLWNRYEKK